MFRVSAEGLGVGDQGLESRVGGVGVGLFWGLWLLFDSFPPDKSLLTCRMLLILQHSFRFRGLLL